MVVIIFIVTIIANSLLLLLLLLFTCNLHYTMNSSALIFLQLTQDIWTKCYSFEVKLHQASSFLVAIATTGWWNYRSAFLGLQHCRLSALLYFMYEKLPHVMSRKLHQCFFSMWRIFCENFKLCCWYSLLMINKIRVDILKHRNQDLHFCSITLEMLHWQLATKFYHEVVPLSNH